MVGVVVVGVGLHVDEVYHTTDILLKTNWQVDWEGLLAQAAMDRLDRLVEVATSLVDLVDKADTWHTVFVSLAPHRLTLGFYPHLAIKDCHCAVEYAQATLHLGSKVDVPRGVNDVNLVTLPKAGHCCRGNGNTTLFFLAHPVGGGTTIITAHGTNLVVNTGAVQNTFCRRRLAGVDMGNNTNVAKVLQRDILGGCHRGLLLSLRVF